MRPGAPVDRAVADALVACVGDDEAAAAAAIRAVAAEDRLDELRAAASFHRVLGWLEAAAATVDDVPEGWRADLWASAAYSARSRALITDELATVDAVFARHGIEWLVLKGPAVAALAYRHPERRSYNDLDVLVRRARFADAVSALQRSGYDVLDRNWTLLRREVAGQVHLRRESGVGVDLHWHPVFSQDLRARLALDADELLDTSRRIAVSGLDVSTLSSTALLVHLCLHAALEGCNRLVWLVDIDRCIRADGSEWSDVVTTARRWRVQLMVGTVLARTQQTLGTDVPPEVVEALVPSAAWRAALRLLDRAFPVARGAARGSPASLVARATRDTVRGTLAEAVVGSVRRAGVLARTGSLVRNERRSDPDSPKSVLHASGDRDDRAEFLRAVAGAGSDGS